MENIHEIGIQRIEKKAEEYNKLLQDNLAKTEELMTKFKEQLQQKSEVFKEFNFVYVFSNPTNKVTELQDARFELTFPSVHYIDNYRQIKNIILECNLDITMQKEFGEQDRFMKILEQSSANIIHFTGHCKTVDQVIDE